MNPAPQKYCALLHENGITRKTRNSLGMPAEFRFAGARSIDGAPALQNSIGQGHPARSKYRPAYRRGFNAGLIYRLHQVCDRPHGAVRVPILCPRRVIPGGGTTRPTSTGTDYLLVDSYRTKPPENGQKE